MDSFGAGARFVRTGAEEDLGKSDLDGAGDWLILVALTVVCEL